MKASFASTIKAGLSWLIPSKMEDRSTPSCSSTRTGRSSLTTTSPNRLRQRRQRLRRNNPKRHKPQFRTKPWSFRPSLSMKMDRKFPGTCEALTVLSGIPKRIPLRAPRGNHEEKSVSHLLYMGCLCHQCFCTGWLASAESHHVATALNHLTVLEFH